MLERSRPGTTKVPVGVLELSGVALAKVSVVIVIFASEVATVFDISIPSSCFLGFGWLEQRYSD